MSPPPTHTPFPAPQNCIHIRIFFVAYFDAQIVCRIVQKISLDFGQSVRIPRRSFPSSLDHLFPASRQSFSSSLDSLSV